MKKELIGCLIIFLIFSLTIDGKGVISISGSYYNSDSSFSDSLSIEDAVYNGFVLLEPSEISFGGSGSGITDDEGGFSQKISYNGQQVGASVVTDSGKYKWNSRISKKNEVDKINKEIAMAVKYDTFDGSTAAMFTSDQGAISEELNAIGSQYSGTASVKPEAIFARGDGRSIQADSCLLGHTITIQDGSHKWAHLDLDQSGVGLNYIWAVQEKIIADAANMGMGLITGTLDGESSVLMTGSAPNFPSQQLPPGKLEVETKPIPSSDYIGNGDETDVAEVDLNQLWWWTKSDDLRNMMATLSIENQNANSPDESDADNVVVTPPADQVVFFHPAVNLDFGRIPALPSIPYEPDLKGNFQYSLKMVMKV